MKAKIVFYSLLITFIGGYWLYAAEPKFYGGGGSANVENDAYGAGWNGDTANAPSQNAVYDKIETIDSGVSNPVTTEQGGLGADNSAVTGIVGFVGGVFVDVDTAAELEIYAGLGAFFSDIADDANQAAMVATLGLTNTTSSSAVITDNRVVRGDGGARGTQESPVEISDTGDVSGVTNFTMEGDLTLSGTSPYLAITGGNYILFDSSGNTAYLLGELQLTTGMITGVDYFSGVTDKITMVVIDPDYSYQSATTPWVMELSTARAITIHRINVSCDINPGAEIELDLMFADALIGLANATKIDDVDTAAGVVTITSGMDDPTIAAGKVIYFLPMTDPDDDIKQIVFELEYSYD